MATSYLVDTNLRVQAIRQKKGRWEFLESLVQAGGSLACSVLTVGELYAGMRLHEKARTEEWAHAADGEPERFPNAGIDVAGFAP
jgi:predicted nucleic acid-binding protein